jgi:ABC-type transport system involved in cytochrome c biogenesis permease subunit
MESLVTALLVGALVTLGGSVLLGSVAMLRSELLRPAHWSLWLAGGLLLAALGVRAVTAGRAPWSNLHETAIAFSFAVVTSYGVMQHRMPIGRLVPLVAAIAAGLAWLALAQPSEVLPLVPALQAPLLLTVHVGAAIAAYALGGLAFAAALAEIAQRQAGNALGFLPAASTARAAAHRAVLLGFPILTAAIVLGSVWANLAWRSYWSNDPKELAAAATWLVYGAYLHVATRRDAWGAAAPWLLVAGFAGVLFTYLGAGLVFVGEHSYAGR